MRSLVSTRYVSMFVPGFLSWTDHVGEMSNFMNSGKLFTARGILDIYMGRGLFGLGFAPFSISISTSTTFDLTSPARA